LKVGSTEIGKSPAVYRAGDFLLAQFPTASAKNTARLLNTEN
jgi:hypothetical protein